MLRYKNSNTLKTRKYSFYYLVLSIILVLFLFIGLTMNEGHILGYYNVLVVIIYLISIVSWLFVYKRRGLLYLLFLLYVFLSCAGQSILEILNSNNFGFINIFGIYSDSLIIKMLFFQSICILFMHNFAILAMKKTTKKRNVYINKVRIKSDEKLLLEIIFYVTSLIQVINLLVWLQSRVNLTYSEFYDLREAQSGYVYGVFFVTMTVYFLINRNNQVKLFAMISIVLFQIVLMMIIGSRTGIISLTAANAFLFLCFENNLINIKRLTPLIIIGLIFAYLISAVYNLRNEVFSIDLLSSIFYSSDYGFFQTIGRLIQEMGVSSRTIIVTIEQTDLFVNHEQTILYDLLNGFIPISVLDFLGISEPTVGELSTWITEINYSNSGWGYSYLAESYFNFGIYGFIFCGIYGYIIVILEMKAYNSIYKGKVLWPSIILYILANQIFFARAQFGLITSKLRISIYILILVYVYLYLTGRVKMNRNYKTLQ